MFQLKSVISLYMYLYNGIPGLYGLSSLYHTYIHHIENIMIMVEKNSIIEGIVL